jgi:hypothetical protein
MRIVDDLGNSLDLELGFELPAFTTRNLGS